MELLASGREALVYATEKGRVLRRFRDPGRSAADEATTLTRLAELGYPVPAVVSWRGPDLVMEQITGPRLSEALLSGRVGFDEGARLLAGLHDDLHRLEWDDGAPLLHLDLHPENVLLGDDGPVVIDWTNARAGDPGLDVALTGLILTQVAVADRALTEPLSAYVATFVAAVGADPAAYVDEAVARRRGDSTQTASELAQLDDAAALLRSLC